MRAQDGDVEGVGEGQTAVLIKGVGINGGFAGDATC